MKDSHLSALKRLLFTTGALVAVGLFAACSTGGETNVPVSNSTTNTPAPAAWTPERRAAKTSTSLVSADPRAQYLNIKRTLTGLVPEPASLDESLDDGRVDIEDCQNGSEHLGIEDEDPVLPLADLAYDVVHISRVLNLAGYPERVWGAPLRELESQQFELILGGPRFVYDHGEERNRAARQRIVRAANEYREEEATDLPEVIDEGGCGAGGVGINVVTEPTGGRVSIIPVFFYELCKSQQLNPDDPAHCDRWREQAAGALMEVSGDYFYRAAWPDGVERRGRLSFTRLKDGQTVTISKP